jgi:hypothetical protein
VFSRISGVVLSGAILAMGAGAAEAQCAAPRDLKIGMTVTETPIRTDRTLKIASLTRRKAGQGPEGPALGLTQSRLGTEISYAMRALPIGDKYCVALERVDVEITLNLVVYLAAELKAGSCIYQEAEKHEQKHVDLERKLLPVARARVEKALSSVVKRTATGASAAAAADRLQLRAKAAVDKVLSAFAAEKKEQQLKFDTIEEYQKLSRQCSAAEIQELLNE